jgi:hypothetical protein
MLSEKYPKEKLAEFLLAADLFKPLPKAEDRGLWEELPIELKEKIIKEAEEFLSYDYPTLPAVRYMDYFFNGDRSRYQKLYGNRRQVLSTLTIAECIENKGRFIEDIINGIWCICEESSWVVPAHNYNATFGPRTPLPNVEMPNIDLFSGETAGLLSFVRYFLKSKLDIVSNLICERIKGEVKQRILDPYLLHYDFWWMSFLLGGNKTINNWNPWINSNCLISFLLLEEDSDRRIQAVEKALRSLDIFLSVYHSDGGCDEGPSYWNRAGGTLFDCLELLYSASSGKINVYDEPLIQNIGRYIYRTFISSNYYLNFADSAAKLAVESELIYRYGKRINDPNLCALGSNSFHRGLDQKLATSSYSLFRRVAALLCYKEIKAVTLNPPYIRDNWMNGIQVMTARETEGSCKGLYLGVKGGHNDESHNHNDVGQFVIYCNGAPFIIDAGVGTYTAKTFGPERYEIWTMQSSYHNLPTVNGVQQAPGSSFKASEVKYISDDNSAELSLNIASAYPQEAGIGSWKRTLRLHRGTKACVEVEDDFVLKESTENITLSLMTCCEIQAEVPGKIILINGDEIKLEVNYDLDKLTAIVEHIYIDDERISMIWGDHVKRILLKSKKTMSCNKLIMRFSEV